MIGAGNMARKVHYPSLASFDDVEIAAVCELDPVRMAEVAHTYGIAQQFSDYRTMVAEVQPTAVYSIGPPQYMYDTWVWILQQGIHLFVEKPLGLTPHQTANLAALAGQSGSITQVGFQRRTTPISVAMRDACLRRGPIRHAVVRFYKNDQRHFTNAVDHMLDDGTHAIDTLRWLCGGDVIDIQSVMRRVGVPDINFITATLTFDTGATGVLLSSWTSGRRIFSIEMHAPGICAELDSEGDGRLYADGDTSGVPYNSQIVAGSDQFFVYGGFQAKSREFIDAIKQGTLPSSHFGDARKTMDIAHRIIANATLAGI
ncbi:MAG: Gfo/Idh/MocA family oxidoreductase [Thermomicrobiales bacterium]